MMIYIAIPIAGISTRPNNAYKCVCVESEIEIEEFIIINNCVNHMLHICDGELSNRQITMKAMKKKSIEFQWQFAK
jgi:hypothetical protein